MIGTFRFLVVVEIDLAVPALDQRLPIPALLCNVPIIPIELHDTFVAKESA